MKTLLMAFVVVVSVSTAFAQGAGRKVYKPGEDSPTPPGVVRTPDYGRAPSELDVSDADRLSTYSGHVSHAPLALGFGAFGMPYGSNWAICGVRLNFGLPGWTVVYNDVYGLDVGLSGETMDDAGGVAVNVFNNTAGDFYGVAVAGMWNHTLGNDSHALQIAPLFNFAERLDGVQIGIYNRAYELHGVQIGVYNSAPTGTGLQIGLWNDNNNGMGSPLMGLVF